MIEVHTYLHDDLLLPDAGQPREPPSYNDLPVLSSILCDGDSRHQRRLPRAGTPRWCVERVDLDQLDYRFEDAEVLE